MRWWDFGALVIIQLIFWIGIFSHVELPGLYMDAVNPTYLAAHTLNPELANPSYSMPYVLVPLLGNLYYGLQNYYVGLPVFSLLGTNLVSLRIAHALFGAAVVAMVYLVALRSTANRMVSLLIAICLATDVAFLASYRTQFHLNLGGVHWLLCSWYFAMSRSPDVPSRRDIFLSGAFFGLAIYGYFNYLFFLPPFLWFVVRHRAAFRGWITGFVVGLLPYAAGYLSLFIALGGIGPTIQWLRDTLSALAPLPSNPTLFKSINQTVMHAIYAVQNTGNELMIFNHAPTNMWAQGKVALFAVVILLGLLLLLRPRSTGVSDELVSARHSVWLPVSFLIASIPLGSRLWVHHYALLVPVLYWVAAVVLYEACQSVRFRGRGSPGFGRMAIVVGMGLLFVVGNLQQQRGFFQRLEATGGVGIMSNSINRLAEDSLSVPVDTVYFFPEWGFFMPFTFLTANRVPYELTLSAETVQKHAALRRGVKVAYWKGTDDDKYRDILTAGGFSEIQIRSYYQRDEQVAFRLMSATAASAGLAHE